VTLQRISIPIIPDKFEIEMQSRSNPQNNMIFWIAPIQDPIRQKPAANGPRNIYKRFKTLINALILHKLCFLLSLSLEANPLSCLEQP
jgi:hypothetical protein